MNMRNRLPELSELWKVARNVSEYPATTSDAMRAAQRIGCREQVIQFIRQFPSDPKPIFESRVDFYTRASELALLMHEEEEQPREVIRSA